MPPFSLLIKPASGNCNLSCQYCFYKSITNNRTVSSYGMMNEETLEVLVKKALAFSDGYCTFAFQGGEPTLVGLSFYKKLVDLVAIYNHKNVKVQYLLQTNGVLIDEEWAKFLSKHQFLVGISLDGPQALHDQHRKNHHGRGSHKEVMHAIKLFKAMGVEFNILCVVTRNVARNVNKVYQYFKRQNFRYLQFIPCLDVLDAEPGSYPFSLSPEIFGDFLVKLFDLWYQDFINGHPISIRYFDNLLGMFLGEPPEACDMMGVCNCQHVFEADGSLYPCDFYMTDEWNLGNIHDMEIEQFMETSTAREFIDMSYEHDDQCESCKWFQLCRGGCRRLRDVYPGKDLERNYYCDTYKRFFEHSYRKFHIAAGMIKGRM